MRIFRVEIIVDMVAKHRQTVFIVAHSLEGALAHARILYRLNAEILEIRRIDEDSDRVVLAGD